MLCFLKIFPPKNSAKKLAFLTQNKAKLYKILGKRQLFRQKWSKIAENYDHNIDPWWLCVILFVLGIEESGLNPGSVGCGYRMD
jgi:hypothetical protein